MIIKKKIKGLIESPNISFRTEPRGSNYADRDRGIDGGMGGGDKL